MSFSGTKRGDRDASEYHANHFHVERGGSKMHPVSRPAASCQHAVLSFNNCPTSLSSSTYRWYRYNAIIAPHGKSNALILE